MRVSLVAQYALERILSLNGLGSSGSRRSERVVFAFESFRAGESLGCYRGAEGEGPIVRKAFRGSCQRVSSEESEGVETNGYDHPLPLRLRQVSPSIDFGRWR